VDDGSCPNEGRCEREEIGKKPGAAIMPRLTHRFEDPLALEYRGGRPSPRGPVAGGDPVRGPQERFRPLEDRVEPPGQAHGIAARIGIEGAVVRIFGFFLFAGAPAKARSLASAGVRIKREE
jgi:hypothetical protein